MDDRDVVALYIAEMRALLPLVQRHIGALGGGESQVDREVATRETVRLATAMADLSSGFHADDCAQLSHALAQAFTAGELGARSARMAAAAADILTYLQARITAMRGQSRVLGPDESERSWCQRLLTSLDEAKDPSAVSSVLADAVPGPLAGGAELAAPTQPAEPAAPSPVSTPAPTERVTRPLPFTLQPGAAPANGGASTQTITPDELEMLRTFHASALQVGTPLDTIAASSASIDARSPRVEAALPIPACDEAGAVSPLVPIDSGSDIADRVPTDEELDTIPPEMQRVFLFEAAEDLKQLRLAALALEAQPNEVEPLLAMSRIAHKVRGTASTLSFDALAELALIFEDHLAAVHSRRATLGAGGVSTLVRYIMLLQEALAAEREGRPQDPSWISQARTLRQGQRVGSGTALDEHVSAASESMPLVTRPLPVVATSKVDVPPRPAPSPEADASVRVDMRRLDLLMNHVSDLSLNRASLAQIRGDGLHLQEEMERALARLTELSTDIIESYPTLARRAMPDEPSVRFTNTGDGWDVLAGTRQDEVDHALRVLMEVVSDLTTTSRTLRSTLTRLSSISDDQAHIAAEIQRDVTRIRLVPLGDIVPRLQLEVRGLAAQLGKHISLTVQGEMTQIDRNVSEALSEPLLQLVRNAAMHGIEPPGERRGQSKPETGSIWLHAYHVGGEVIIEVGDDGRGINPHVLAASAVALGLLDAEAARALSISEALDLMFWPGITGKPGADVLGGRGIGLVDVRTAVEALKGSIHVHNSAGQSTVFRIRVPMSLSIVRALLVRSAEYRYAIPFASVLHTVTLAEGDVPSAAPAATALPNSSAASRRIMRLEREHRGAQLDHSTGAHEEVPVVALLDLLGLDNAGRDAQTALIIQVRRGRVAVLVDEIYGDQEVVVRALPTHLRRKSVRGTTVTPSGEVLLLLDVSELAAAVLDGGPLPMPHYSRPLPQLAQSMAPRVLVVDDSISIRRSLEQALDHAGFEVQLARDGIEALEMMLTSLPRVVVLDIEMPRLDGFELLSILRGSPQFEGVRVAILTSRATDKHRERAASLGASAYLVKPCPAETLIDTVCALIGESVSVS